MNLQDQLDVIKQQLSSVTNAVDILQRDLQQSSSASAAEASSASSDMITALAGYLALSPSLAGDELLEMTLRCAMQVVGAGGAGLTLFDQEKQKLVFTAAIGDGSEGIIGYEVPLKGSQHGLAFATGDVQSATPLHSGAEEAAKAVFRNVLVAPLLVDGDGVGTMSAVNKQDGDHFTPADMEAYQMFADLAALIVRQSLRGQIFENFIQGDVGTVPSELEGLQLGEDDRLLLDSILSLVSLARNRSDLLPICSKIIEQMTEK